MTNGNNCENENGTKVSENEYIFFCFNSTSKLTCSVHFTFLLQSAAAPWPVTNYTAWLQRHMGVNNLA